ncbi:MAG: DUF2237 domain-containing protein [Pseudomonadales bacterium]|uniref:DUF2237 domain-containing protein n=1 Tax=Oleiphilus messinensis TaxID=141451 RepID=A0A1Y0I2S5_9GAMM|nr:DUF2237 domain-containing protein [Oleiphilus messinensis]ARU54711.1 hypothetical protein OLMES_0608 [Oleiphilus messinensis]MCG8609831.1 DUF2237 domain-containing protein [Pseudomonadales bacterium]
MELVKNEALNVLGLPLESCSLDPKTGFFRDGHCNTCEQDAGSHTVCAVMTQEFLEYSRFKGNDLSTARPEFGFPGLKSGDSWCLCASRWRQAFEDGMAPRIRIMATHIRALEIIDLETLKTHAEDLH